MLGENLRKARTEKGLTLVEVAKEVGVSHVAIINMENGKRMPSVPTLVLLARVLGKSIDELVK